MSRRRRYRFSLVRKHDEVAPIVANASDVSIKRQIRIPETTTTLQAKYFDGKAPDWSEQGFANEIARLKAARTKQKMSLEDIAAQTRTPQHYLIGKMANLSGDALLAAETGLVKRTEEKCKSFGRGIREVFRLVALVRGEKEKADAVRLGTVVWANVAQRSEAQLADAAQKWKAAGFPIEWIARRIGMSPTEITDLVESLDAQTARDPVAQFVQATAPPEVE